MEKPKFKTVQEVIAGGEGLPERYLHKPTGDGEPLDASVPEMDIPAIDLSLLLSSSHEELTKLRSSLSTWGVVQLMNHGMTEELLDKVRELSRLFFGLPNEEKHKYARETGSTEGYGNDMILFEDQVLDWNDRLFLTTHPEGQRKLEFWPETPVGFRETVHELTKKQRRLSEQLLMAMARSLELDESRFLQMQGDNSTFYTRFTFYPPCPKPDKVLGVKPHADGYTITILLQDKEVESLQFLKDGKWYRPPVVPATILVVLGDQIEIMSNGIYKSPVHRVVTNMEKERVSVATFWNPDRERDIQPVEELVTETRPKLYKTVNKYLDIYHESYQRGRRPIESAIIE
ncbi:PREDICTED: protein SRG1-like [Tarenaya hassleriana]|uniref:protein SRG1-like n=1 Tax=Tarenaya hassleriana TaxID=28532 RepID=UPI00053C6EA9|nr:PREDICTED: protein SRG1-like [Tarenaya hassleriana]